MVQSQLHLSMVKILLLPQWSNLNYIFQQSKSYSCLNGPISTTSFNSQNPTPASMVQSQLHLSMVKIQLSMTKYPTLASMVQSQVTSFQNPQILRTISSGHNVIHTPAPFLVCGFIMINGDYHIL